MLAPLESGLKNSIERNSPSINSPSWALKTTPESEKKKNNNDHKLEYVLMGSG